MSTALGRRIVRVCWYAGQWVTFLLLNNNHWLLITFPVCIVFWIAFVDCSAWKWLNYYFSDFVLLFLCSWSRLGCCTWIWIWMNEITTTTVLRPFFPGPPVPEENFWTLWRKGRLTEADTSIIWMGATPSGLVTSAHLHHPPYFLQAGCPSLPPNQQRQSTEGN